MVNLERCLSPSGCETADLAKGRDAGKVREAAEQFEALLIGQMLKTIRESSGADGWMGGSGGATDSVMEYAEQNLASVLSSKGGLGLASLVAKGLAQSSSQASKPAPVAGTDPETGKDRL